MIRLTSKEGAFMDVATEAESKRIQGKGWTVVEPVVEKPKAKRKPRAKK
jgi:hypothetical protein